MIFDLGGTLWYWPNRDPTRQGAWFWGLCYDHLRRQALAEKSAGPLLATRREAFAEAMVASEEEYRRSAREQTYSADPVDIVAVGFARLGFSLGEQELLATLEGYAKAVEGQPPAPFPDAHQTLFGLRNAGYQIGLLSNTWWAAEWLEAQLGACGLHNLLDEVLYTSELPHTKPHPSVFLEAASRLGVEPERCVMVGDDPVGDVAGALGAGMRAVWKRACERPTTPEGTQPSATAVVDRLAELPDVLRSWRTSR